jgi:sporulation protein YlmC with PRC-barrel domain
MFMRLAMSALVLLALFLGMPQLVAKTARDEKYTVFPDNMNDPGLRADLNLRSTIAGLVGQPVGNIDRRRVGFIKDIIFDEKGKALLVVIADDDFFKLGAKDVALDYNAVVRSESDGDVVRTLRKPFYKTAKMFSYDSKTATNPYVRTMPANAYSAVSLLGREILGPDKKPVGTLDNIGFKRGRADTVFISPDITTATYGKNAAFLFKEIGLARKNAVEGNFQLSGTQVERFEAYEAPKAK